MSDDSIILDALAAAVAGDRVLAAALLIQACPTENDGWVAACGYAAMICAGVRVAKEVDDHAKMTAFAVDDPDAANTDDYAEILAAFIAAIGNDDYEGGRRMFKSLRSTYRKQRLIGDLLSIAVLVVQRQARREETS